VDSIGRCYASCFRRFSQKNSSRARYLCNAWRLNRDAQVFPRNPPIVEAILVENTETLAECHSLARNDAGSLVCARAAGHSLTSRATFELQPARAATGGSAVLCVSGGASLPPSQPPMGQSAGTEPGKYNRAARGWIHPCTAL